MSRRCWGLAVLGIFVVALTPSRGESQNPSAAYNKDAVKALSQRIDEHLAKVWKKAGVKPAAKAEDHIFFRRLNLDLVGRIPELLPITDFVDPTDDRPDKRWIWVDQFLESAEYSRHFGNVWRSIIIGNQTNPQFQFLVPQFEAWLRERVEKNVGLDKTVHQLLTSTQNNPNMGFAVPLNSGRVPGSPQLFFLANENKAENLAGATSRLFLGVKIECAQCHEHPFAKWKKEQFWEFAAFYSAPQGIMRNPGGKVNPQPAANPQAGREIRIPGTEKVVKAKYLNGEEPKWESFNNSRKTLADWMTAPNNPYFAKTMADHIWSYLMGVSLLEPIMEPSDDSPVTHPELLDDLARGLIENNFDAKFLIRAIVHSDAYQRSSGGTKLADKEDYQLFVRMPIRAMSPEQIFDSVSLVTHYKDPTPAPNQQFFNPNQSQSARAQFLTKFMNQDRRHEPQTSILQALFMMNSKFISERTKTDHEDLVALVKWKEGSHARRVRSLYMLVLSRPPRQEETDRLVLYLERNSASDDRLGEALSDVFWALLNSSEFLLNH
jgi:hypothetical protein